MRYRIVEVGTGRELYGPVAMPTNLKDARAMLKRIAAQDHRAEGARLNLLQDTCRGFGEEYIRSRATIGPGGKVNMSHYVL